MKKIVMLIIAAIFAIFLMSLKNAGEILNSLGLTSDTSNTSIIKNVTGVEEFKLPYLKISTEILTGNKTAADKVIKIP